MTTLTPAVNLVKLSQSGNADVSIYNTNLDRLDKVANTPLTINGMKNALNSFSTAYTARGSVVNHPSFKYTVRCYKINDTLYGSILASGAATVGNTFSIPLPEVDGVTYKNTDLLKEVTDSFSAVAAVGKASLSTYNGAKYVGSVRLLQISPSDPVAFYFGFYADKSLSPGNSLWDFDFRGISTNVNLGASAPWYVLAQSAGTFITAMFAFPLRAK